MSDCWQVIGHYTVPLTCIDRVTDAVNHVTRAINHQYAAYNVRTTVQCRPDTHVCLAVVKVRGDAGALRSPTSSFSL